MYLWELWSKFTDFIEKDTQVENESKKTAVVIRILTLSFIAYLLIPAISWNVVSSSGGFVIYLIALLIFVGVFAATYKLRTLWFFTGLSVAMIFWIISFIYLFGWNVGVQHFLMVLLVLVFFAQYNNLKFKAFFATGLCILHIALYFIFCDSKSLVEISSKENNSLQIINTIFIFWLISVISYIYGRDSQELESKLIAYNEELKAMANTDKLTSLYNRRRAIEYIEECCKKSWV